MSQNSHGQNKMSAHINRKHISMQKRLTIKKGIGKNLTFAKITIRCKQSHTLWKRTQKNFDLQFQINMHNNICQR